MSDRKNETESCGRECDVSQGRVAHLQAHCVECHQAGEIGPFALTDYDEVIGWADMMLEVIDDGRMPPWHASPEHGQFRQRALHADADKQTLRDWVAAGVPYGDVAELPPPIPPAPTGTSTAIRTS